MLNNGEMLFKSRVKKCQATASYFKVKAKLSLLLELLVLKSLNILQNKCSLHTFIVAGWTNVFSGDTLCIISAFINLAHELFTYKKFVVSYSLFKSLGSERF